VEKADVWALGIIAYFLLSGQPPFTGPPEKDALFKTASYVFMPAELWRPVSAEAKNFIAMCLQETPMDRPRAEKILNLPWMSLAKKALEEEAEMKRIGRWPPPQDFKKSDKLSLMDPPLPSAERVKSSFARMNQLNVLEKAAVIAAAHRLQEHKISDLSKAYEAMDRKQEGVITTQEFFEGLESCGVPCKELAELIKGIDVNGSRMIEYHDFISAIEDFQRNMQDSAVWAVFRNFDSQGNKAVLKSKLVEALGRKTHRKSVLDNFPELPLESVLEELDHDSNGVIEFEEFKNILRQSGNSVSTTSSKGSTLAEKVAM
jgi:calcium-dependent protein kinase